MIAAHVGDLHLTDRGGDSRATLEEQVELLTWIGKDAASAEAEVMLVAGDVFDAASSPRERRAAADVLTAWGELMPVVTVRGNHDSLLDLDILGRLRSKFPIRVFEEPGSVRLDGLLVACIPWPQKAWLAARMLGANGPELNATAAQAMRAILQGLALQFQAATVPAVLLAHLELGATLTDSGQPMAGRCDIELSEADVLATGADYVALGHIHKPQTIGDRIRYAGAPRQTNFGEEGGKGYSLVTLERGKAPVIEHRPVPSRQLVTITGKWADGAFSAEGEGSPRGKAVRLTYEVDEAQRVQVSAAAAETREALLAGGAHSVTLDPRMTPASRVRCEAIRTARTTAEKLNAYWTAQGHKPDRAEAITEKLGQLEAEVV
jgi:exonuclease SbcD